MHESVVGNVLVGIAFEPFQSVGRGVAVEGHGTFHIEVVIVRHHVERLAIQFRIGRDCRALPHIVAVLERVKCLVADVRSSAPPAGCPRLCRSWLSGQLPLSACFWYRQPPHALPHS